jgi:hypothetical protein
MADLSPFDLGWLVGWLEGEGCFTLTNSQHGLRRSYVGIQVGSTDLDTAQKAASLLDAKIHEYIPSKSHLGKKPYYSVHIYGRRAISVALLVLPHMGTRRRGQIIAALQGSKQFQEMIEERRKHG